MHRCGSQWAAERLLETAGLESWRRKRESQSWERRNLDSQVRWQNDADMGAWRRGVWTRTQGTGRQ